MVKIIECPRDAMQGLTEFVPTEKKIEYRVRDLDARRPAVRDDPADLARRR